MCEMNQTEILRKNLSIFRKQRHLTQEQLANELGLTFQAISKWENGLSCPDISLLPQLAEIFGVTIDDLFREQTEVEEKNAKEAETPAGGIPEEAEKPEEENEQPADGKERPKERTVEISGDEKGVRKMLKDLGIRLEPEINSLNQAADELLQNLFGSKHEPVTLPDLSEERPVSDGPAEGLPWEDDGIYRAVLFKGRTLVCASPEGKGAVGNSDMDLDRSILSCFSVCCGDVDGNVSAAGNVACDDVDGNVAASGNVTCDDIEGDAAASGNLNCGDVGGNASAGGELKCGEVGENASAGGNLTCSNVDGNVSAEGNVTCKNVEGKVSAGGDVKIG